ncbi:cytochrome c oxidase subunit II [Deferribacter thermophilus]|uniref:cytochrome c oxidase subunit II n=1 Tax=Deferribacter thermophilus TaxID=53573 RepID=UPI003C14EA44
MYPQVNAVQKVDFAFIFIFSIAIIILIGITITIVLFLIKYNKNKNPEPADIKGNLIAETLWTVIPTIIVIGMFFAGWNSFVALRTVPKNAIEIGVEAKMWSWKFTYPNGKTDKELYVPINKPVKLNITSKDVIHSFYVPAYRIKIDAVPGLVTYAWFNPDKLGDFDILCAEYCGVRHAYMISKVHVVTVEEYMAYLEKKEDVAKVNDLPTLLDKYGCSDCHSLDGSVIAGPPLNNLMGKKRIVIENGAEKEIMVDENYLRESILNPAAKIVKDFENIMPSYKDEISDEDLQLLIELLLGKKEINLKKIGEKLAEDEGCTSCHSTDGSILAAPSFKNLYNKKHIVIKNGKKVEIVADENYLYNSIKKPEEEIVEGFDPIMPPYDYLTDEQIKSLIEYIKSLQ